MEIEDFIKSGNIQKYGFFFWIMLSGVAILALSVSHGFAPRYGGLGIIFFIGGVVGYSFLEIMDSYSAHKLNSKPTWKFHLIISIVKFLILIGIVLVAQEVYHFFPIAASVPPRNTFPIK